MKTELIDKLKAFGKAASELSDAWIQAESNSDDNVLNCVLYPFKSSFDEVANDIDNWVEDNIKFKKALFRTTILNDEYTSMSLEYLEDKLHQYASAESVASPTIYFPKDLPAELDLSDEDKSIYSYVLLYNIEGVYYYIGILK